MRPNKIRALLKAGKPTLGTRIQSPWPTIVEIIGHSGMFDYVEFLAEYTPYTLHDLENLCRAAEVHDLGTMIKIDAETRVYLAKLASITGSAGDSQLAAAPPFDPFAWRRAALFAARANDIAAASESLVDERAADMGATVKPAANSLFVALSGQKQP